MLYEYQAVLAPDPSGTPKTLLIRHSSPAQVRAMLAEAGLNVLAIGPGLPVLDPHQATFTKEEAAVLLRSKTTDGDSSSLIDKLMAAGILPRPVDGRPIFTRSILLRAVARRMGTPVEAL